MLPRQARRYDIYLPIQYNDGISIEEEKFVQVQRELFRKFGGLTSIKREFPLRGMWGNETTVYEDEIIILTVVDFSDNVEETEQFITDYKEILKIRFEQEEIFITGQDLTIY
jgi:hypothetical protein